MRFATQVRRDICCIECCRVGKECSVRSGEFCPPLQLPNSMNILVCSGASSRFLKAGPLIMVQSSDEAGKMERGEQCMYPVFGYPRHRYSTPHVIAIVEIEKNLSLHMLLRLNPTDSTTKCKLCSPYITNTRCTVLYCIRGQGRS